MNKLIEIGNHYKEMGVATRSKMVKYYNENCIPLVPPTKKHYMSLAENWCGMFVSVIAHKSELGKKQFPYGVSVYEMMEQAKRWGTFKTDITNAEQGDLIIFDWNGNGKPQHIGFICNVSDELIITLEGNYSGTVKSRHLKPHSPAVMGYISVGGEYEEYEHSVIDGLVERTLLGEFGTGEERRVVLGSMYDEVQRIINERLGG